MTLNLVRKRGIPVLAYSTFDHLTPSSCILTIRHCEDPLQTTLSLLSSIPIHGCDDEQTFTLIYDADNLVSGKTKLGPAAIRLPQDRLHKITRSGNPQLKTLSLTLNDSCSIWGPLSPPSIAPKPGFESSFHQLVQLAGALQIHILFDYSWLHQDQHTRFGCLFSHGEVLTGLRIEENFAKLHRRIDLAVLSSVEDAVGPPSYSDLSNKRPRQREFFLLDRFFDSFLHLLATTSTSPEPPSSKRALLSFTDIDAPSPTEKATPPPSPPAYAPAPEDATRNAVATILPILQSILPELLRPFLAVAPPSPSPPRTNTGSKKLSSLSTLLNARVAAHLEAQQPKLYAGMLDYAEEINSAAGIELQETLEDHRLDIAIANEDGIAELNSVIDEKLLEFKSSTQEIVDELGEHAGRVYTETREKLDELVGKQLASLRRQREELERERKEFEAEKRRPLGRKISRDQSRRAISLPP
jgi:hypothetical protein